MDGCKCIVPLRRENTPTIRRAASPLVSLVVKNNRGKIPDHLQGLLLQNWGGTEQNHTAHAQWCSKLLLTTGVDLVFFRNEFPGPIYDTIRKVALTTTETNL
ncbi:hypothetical protein TNCV_4824541 [Trichonephila clavipes]|nr:hypothetical protein TNCV_4824541 [Trichonephila clavipes]